MTPLSGRYVLPLLLLMGVALVPIAWHANGRTRFDDCARPELLRDPDVFGSDPFTHPDRSPKWWSEGTLSVETTDSADPILLSYAMLRSPYPTSLTLRPHSYLIEHFEPERTWQVRVADGDAHVPVHFALDRTAPGRLIAGYLFVYRGAVVAHPFWTRLRWALHDLVNGMPRFTLIVVSGPGSTQVAELEQGIARWLVGAWHRYQSICSAEPDGA